MKKFLLSEVLYGFLLTVLVVGSYFNPSSFLEMIELKFYDIRSQARQPASSAKEIALITIDDDSLAKLGRWPWPRSRIAQLLDYLREKGQPKVIGLNIIFSEPEQSAGRLAVERLAAAFAAHVSEREEALSKERDKQLAKLRSQILSQDKEFLAAMEAARIDLDQDAKLQTAIAAAPKVVLPIFFQLGAGLDGKPRELPEYIKRSAVSTMAQIGEEGIGRALEAMEVTVPIAPLAQSAAGIGHVNTLPDPDGVIRSEPLVIRYGGSTYPSFALELVRQYLGLSSEDITAALGSRLFMGRSEIPLNLWSGFAITYNGGEKSFPHYSFFDVVEGKVAPEAFKDKIVIVGPTAAGVGTTYTTTLTHNFPAVELVANVIENLLHKRFLTRPSWAYWVELSLMLLIGIFVCFVLPRMKAGGGAVLSAILLAAILGAGFYLFISQDKWLKMSYPAVLLAAGYTVVVSKRFLVTERSKELVEASAIETNKMLGLSFQGQGMLDLAFEKFRKCPMDDQMKDLLYNLALDFERKRQFNKAVAVYEHISATDKNYKDIAKKIDVLKKAAEGSVIGSAIGSKGKDATIMVEGASVAATLGRYEIIRELGKGAMGIVYLGRDPKINRQVAIKTMRFEDDVDEDTIKAVKDRFFREAESAGNLSHPNIIKIYDAGEEHDVSYIAMELLEGEDLKKFTLKENRLPIAKAVEYIAIVAEALDYAHKQGVVHRDIKPANIMLLKDGSLRVTDFGIARIQASSKTATGTVLGTPAYMSPEQIAGKKVDGRSDLFSLGVTLFELLTCEKPWKGGESMGTLLFQIANDPHPDPISIRPDIPKDLVAVIDKALKKNPDERYASGAQIAEDLRAFLAGKPPVHAKTAATQQDKLAEAVTPKPAAAVELKPEEKTVPAAQASVAAAVPSKPAQPTEPAAKAPEPAATPADDKTVLVPPEPTVQNKATEKTDPKLISKLVFDSDKTVPLMRAHSVQPEDKADKTVPPGSSIQPVPENKENSGTEVDKTVPWIKPKE